MSNGIACLHVLKTTHSIVQCKCLCNSLGKYEFNVIYYDSRTMISLSYCSSHHLVLIYCREIARQSKSLQTRFERSHLTSYGQTSTINYDICLTFEVK